MLVGKKEVGITSYEEVQQMSKKSEKYHFNEVIVLIKQAMDDDKISTTELTNITDAFTSAEGKYETEAIKQRLRAK